MNTNWPEGTDYSSQNWTLRTPRESRYQGGNWAPDSHRIPPIALAYVAGVIAFFAVVAFVGTLFFPAI